MIYFIITAAPALLASFTIRAIAQPINDMELLQARVAPRQEHPPPPDTWTTELVGDGDPHQDKFHKQVTVSLCIWRPPLSSPMPRVRVARIKR